MKGEVPNGLQWKLSVVTIKGRWKIFLLEKKFKGMPEKIQNVQKKKRNENLDKVKSNLLK